MPHRLYQIVSILKVALIDLEKIKNKDLIIVLGNTGCGKSTMLNSLLLGPDSLHEIKQQDMNAKKKRFKKVIATKENLPTLKIGHENDKS